MGTARERWGASGDAHVPHRQFKELQIPNGPSFFVAVFAKDI